MSKQLWIINETKIGGWELLRTLDHGCQPLVPVEKSVKLGLCNGFRSWMWQGPPSMEFIKNILEQADFLLVDYWIGSTLSQRHIAESGKSEEAYHDYNIRILKEAVEKYGDKIFWTITGEPDSQGINFPKEQLASKEQAHHFCVQWIKDVSPAMDPNTKLRWSSYLKKKNIDLKAHNIAIHLGRPFMSHYAFETGVRLVWVECNCGLHEGLQRIVAFTRGAANQFRANKTYWGVDFSPWNDRSDTFLHYDENGQRLGGLTENLLLRELMCAFLAGSNLILEETSDCTNWINKLPTWYSKLSPMGKKAAKFGKFARTFDRGEPYRPVAVMLEQHHGWGGGLDDANTNQVWFGAIPTKKADLTIGQFFDLAFPGHDEYYSKQASQFSQNPWKNIEEYRTMIASGKDMRTFEGGRLATSRWGDVIDVVLENCPDDVLSEYKVLVLLGELKVDDNLLERLKKFVRSGGTVVANATNYFNCPEDALESVICHGKYGRNWSIPSIRPGEVPEVIEQFVGFQFTSEKTKGSVSYCPKTKEYMNENGFTFEKIQLKKANAIATCVNWLWGTIDAPEHDHVPIAVEHKLGKGKVITTLPYFMMHPVYRTPLKISGNIYDQAINSTLPYTIEGEPIQYMFNKVSDDTIVSLFNNGSKLWKGYIVSESKPEDTKFEWANNAPAKWFKEANLWKLNVTVPKFSFKIITVKNRVNK